MREVATEIHGEVCQILQHDYVMLGGKFANALQFLFGETHPCRIIRIAIDNAGNITLREHLIKFLNQLRTAIIVDIKSNRLQANHLTLVGLHRETWMNEKNRVALRHSKMQSSKDGKCPLHRTNSGNTTFRFQIDADEGHDKSGGCILERSDTGIGRIDGCTTLVERFFLGIHTDL